MRKDLNHHLVRRNGTWHIVYKRQGKRIEKTLNTGSVEDARARRDAILDKAWRERQGLEASAPTFTKLEEGFEKFEHASTYRKACKPEQLATKKRYWTRFLTWLAGKYPNTVYCNEVTGDMAREWLNSLDTQTGADQTWNNHKNHVKQIFRVLARFDRSIINPFEGATDKPANNRGERRLTEDELWAIFAIDNYEWQLFCAVGLYTQLRRDNAVKLQWAAYDGRILTAHHTKTEKSCKNKDVTDATQVVCENLKYWLDKTPIEQRRGAMFPTFSRMTTNQLSTQIRGFFNLAGIKDTQEPVLGNNGKVRQRCKMGFHSFRHTGQTLAIEAGASEVKVKLWGGHSTGRIQDIYNHPLPELRGEVAGMLKRYWK